MHRARKRFGQHFLTDQNIIRKIVTAIQPQPGQYIVEIGPGQGAMTIPLLEISKRLEVVELDRDLIPILQRNCAGLGELHIHNADALKFDFTTLAPQHQIRVTGNLPYNISTPLMFHLLEQAHHIQDMHFMLQKEVVDRMAASPGNKDYGRLSVMMQYQCQVIPLFDISRNCFSPPPRVESAFVRLVPHTTPPVSVNDPAALQQVVTLAFNQRRKTLRNALKRLLTEEQLESAGVDPTLRADHIDLATYARLSNLV
jgi:16S rRNA (adenine1518-N6/adenine1519-N6)-dimethyltransferase